MLQNYRKGMEKLLLYQIIILLQQLRIIYIMIDILDENRSFSDVFNVFQYFTASSDDYFL